MKKLVTFTLLIIALLGYHAFCQQAAQKRRAKMKHRQTLAMVFVQGGSFNMGSNDYDDDASPIHKVKLSSFYIGKYEVTRAEWIAIMGRDSSYSISQTESIPIKGQDSTHYGGLDDYPIARVNWDDIQNFIEKLNRKTGKHYRLPTEAEWEYAARGGNKSKNYTYSGSNELSAVGWYVDNDSKMHPKGQKKPNELGIYDMSGNAWEWCRDWYNRNYYSDSPAENPVWSSAGTKRVVRGGGRNSVALACRIARRDSRLPNYRYDTVGFRLVLDAVK